MIVIVEKMIIFVQKKISSEIWNTFTHTSERSFSMAVRIFILGKLPSGRGSSQFFRRVNTP